MFGLGLPEIIVIFIIALIVFGPKKLPDLGKSIGRAMAEFKKAQQEFQESVQAEMKEVEKSANLHELKRLGGPVEFSSQEGAGTKKASIEQEAAAAPDQGREATPESKNGEAEGNG